MASLLRETIWKGWRTGDLFRVPGIRARRFRFRAHVTNFENGTTSIEATDVADGSFRSFDPRRRIVRVRGRS
jgi:hypothetical protein